MTVDLRFLVYNIDADGTSSPEDAETIREITNVIDWLGLWTDHKGGWQEEFRDMDISATVGSLKNLQQRECIRDVKDAVRTASLQKLGICPSRLWNLAVGRSNDLDSMLLILDYLSKHERDLQVSRPSHDECTEELCIRAYDDTTTTLQLHKCQGKDCGSLEFPIKKLDEAFVPLRTPVPWIPTAWDMSGDLGKPPKLAEPGQRFIAISHVWSNGTGNGLNKQGIVNTCLIKYWAGIAKTLDCEGLWWDTICVPMGKQSRRKALDVMLGNFCRATYVVVHDQELVNMPWTNSTSAAIAILLSTWFTRGWTAAEFYATRKRTGSIKVLFQNPQNIFEPIIKDLDRDILSRPQQMTTLAHFKASAILRGVRGDITDLRGLLQVLRARSTAWDKDRVVVASLMTLEQEGIDTSMSTPHLTRAILRRLITVPKTAIFHNKVPMTTHGGWSWCPPSIFDFDVGGLTTSDSSGGGGRQTPVMVDADGCAFGRFMALTLLPEHKGRIHPYSTHPSILCRMSATLETPENCLVLKVGGGTGEFSMTTGILVEPVEGSGKYIGCRYIGCAYLSFPFDTGADVVECSIGYRDVDEDGHPRPAVNAKDILLRSRQNISTSSA